MKMDDAMVSSLREVLAELCPGLPVRLVVLFGSQAEQQAGRDSDVDIAVELTDRREWQALERVALTIERHVGSEVDLVATNGAEPALLMDIAEIGVLLYEAATGDWAQFRAEANRAWEHTAPTRTVKDGYLLKKWGTAA